MSPLLRAYKILLELEPENKESAESTLASEPALSEQNQTTQAARLLDSMPLAAASQAGAQ